MTESKKSRLLIKILLPLAILAVGIFAFKMLSHLKREPQRQRPVQLGILVDVIELQAKDHQVRVFATGTVQPGQEIELVPQVSGAVTWISPNLVAGGFFKKGDLLLEIETADYRLAVEQANAEIAQARLSLATEKERARVALLEWDRVRIKDKGTPGPLVTREIQLQQEEARLAAARANLKQARLNLDRTRLRAPFNGRVRSEQVDIGQYLRSGTAIATLAGTDRAEVHVPVATEELNWLDLDGKTKPPASVRVPGRQGAPWRGTLVRTLGEIDAKSRLATLIVEIRDPYRQTDRTTSGPLPNGQFVSVELQGRTLNNVIEIPRKALRPDNRIWLADSEDRLAVLPVRVIRREQDSVIIEPDIPAAGRLIVSALSGVAEGTLLRPVRQEKGE